MERVLALFDFDGTMIAGDSIARLVRRMALDGLMGPFTLLRVLLSTLLWKLGLMRVEAVKTLSLSPLNKLSPEQAERYCARFAQEQLLPRIYPQALGAMRSHQAQGHLVLLVSASPDCYLRHLQAHLPVDHIIASTTDTGHQVTRNTVREMKNELVNQWLDQQGIRADWQASFAYGDSANDLDMLGMVGQPCLVNPHRKALRLGAGIPHTRWR
ncbi:MAG: HAD-IB family hydrolase [Clostridiales bacterium]|nr:HAD-IB family hydrolase [Clostridiales bacterium]